VTVTEPRRQAGSPTGYPWRRAAPPAARPTRPQHGASAGMVTRSLANVVDLLLVALLVCAGWLGVAAARFLVHPARFTLPSPGAQALLFIGLGVLAAYFAVTWAIVGGTYGDRLLAVRVVDRQGARLHWGRCVLRAVLCTIFPIGLFWVLVSGTNRSVQDLLVRTAVVHDG
jgi:uncharacterized RDD family membrane protein YckC